MKSSDTGCRPEAQRPFLDRVREVLNAHVYCVSFGASPPLDDSNFVESVRELLSDPGLSAPLTAAVLEDDPIPEYLRCPFTPCEGLYSLPVWKLDESAARQRLESMLIPRAPYTSPYARATSPEGAAELVSSFLDGFVPRPTHFAEIDPQVLQGWTWVERGHASPPFPDVLDMNALPPSYVVTPFLQGFNDSVLAMAAGSHLALLINNGSD